MRGVEVAVEIETSPGDAFDYYVVPENHLVWQEDLLDVERLTDGAVGMGSRFRLQRRLGGRIHQGVWEITEFERPRKVCLTALTDQGMIDHRSQARFEPADIGTRLILRVQPTPRGWVRLLTPLIGRAIRRELPKDLEQLKAVLEERA